MAFRRQRGRDRQRSTLQPNQLSIDLVPNRLSILEGQSVGVASRPGTARQGQPSTRPAAPARAPRTMPSLSTLIAAGIFAVFVLSQVLRSLPAVAPGLLPTTPAEIASGTVVFGTGLGQGCAVQGEASAFPGATDVWWVARFDPALDPQHTVVWTVTKDGVVVAEGEGPSKPPPGPWDTMCANRPLAFGSAGSYRLDVVDAQTGMAVATGTYELH